MRYFMLPPSWDLEYQMSKMDKFKELGGRWDPERKEWAMDKEIDTSVIDDWLEVYEYV